MIPDIRSLLSGQGEGILPALFFRMFRVKNNKGPRLLLIGVGSILTSIIVAGFILGYAIDVWLETQPLFMLSVGLLGIVGGILKVYRLLMNPEMY